MEKLNPEKETLLVVCPGRGSYTKETLGYFHQYHNHSQYPYLQQLLSSCDEKRRELGQISLAALDKAKDFDPVRHTLGENASALIYLCAFGDFYQLMQKKYNVVAVTGNSMGHYISCVCAQSIDAHSGFDLINTMGSMMTNNIIGGQVIDSLVDDTWICVQDDEQRSVELLASIPDLYNSIDLGGYRVYGGSAKALKELLTKLPVKKPYPFKLINHGAFHTPLLKDISNRALEIFPKSFFGSTQIPLVDGHGSIYSPMSMNPMSLYNYTFVDQVLKTYSFTKAISVALKEYAPSKIVLLGPGNSLGGAIGQILISLEWMGIKNKIDFTQRQKENPYLISLGLPEQRCALL